MLKRSLEKLKNNPPLIHNITNYVTVNDCANILLACGASPIMSDEIKEVEEITTICTGLNINIGTLNERAIKSMIAAGKKANELSRPVILDPVGVGASKLRNETASRLLEEIQFTVIRGNVSEIKALAVGSGGAKGVDADIADLITEDTLEATVSLAKKYAKKTGAIIAISGAIDIVADEERAFVIHNGHEMMARITGSGCMLSALLTAYVAANREESLEAAAAAVCAMGICGEVAKERMSVLDGNSTYRNYLIDAMYNLDEEALEKGSKYEIK